MGIADDQVFLPSEPEVLAARLGYPDAQVELAGTPYWRATGLPGVGWYGTDVSAETGSFGLVNIGGPLESLIGDRLKLTYRGRSAFVYVFGSDYLIEDLHITRRAFAALELLAVGRIGCIVEAVSG